MDLQSLRLFVLASETLNITAAGRKLGMAPAVASARLAKLEKELGADLLHRSTRKVSLSLEGRDFLPYAREILAQENAARVAMGLESENVRGTLRFTAPSSFSQIYIAPLVPGFLARYPDIRLEMRMSDSQFDLIDGSYDLALRNAPLEDSSLKGRKLANDRRILCASPGYLAAAGKLDTPEDLDNHLLIGFRGMAPRMLKGLDGTTGLFHPSRVSRHIEVDDGMVQKALTLGDGGISLNSIWNIYRELEQGQLVRVLPDFDVEDSSALWLIYPKTNMLTAKVRVFMDYLLESLGASPPWERTKELPG